LALVFLFPVYWSKLRRDFSPVSPILFRPPASLGSAPFASILFPHTNLLSFSRKILALAAPLCFHPHLQAPLLPPVGLPSVLGVSMRLTSSSPLFFRAFIFPMPRLPPLYELPLPPRRTGASRDPGFDLPLSLCKFPPGFHSSSFCCSFSKNFLTTRRFFPKFNFSFSRGFFLIQPPPLFCKIAPFRPSGWQVDPLPPLSRSWFSTPCPFHIITGPPHRPQPLARKPGVPADFAPPTLSPLIDPPRAILPIYIFLLPPPLFFIRSKVAFLASHLRVWISVPSPFLPGLARCLCTPVEMSIFTPPISVMLFHPPSARRLSLAPIAAFQRPFSFP